MEKQEACTRLRDEERVMKQAGYPFQYLGSNTIGADQYLKETHIYGFVSTKSGHRYQVNIERYVDHLYCVKFFDLTANVEVGKFSYLTGTYEPRTIFRTIANIALDIYYRDPEASFFFIGASDGRDKSGMRNRRYQVYSNFVYDLDLSNLFEVHLIDYYSMCVLVNRRAVPDMDAYMQRIIDFIAL